ncbi:sulfotransferase 1C2-like isoform X1 [Haliotis rubra]|uniref:sulfotransferase 1C2-like isoform X1 n=1 Tax=Haliotis rubra TaxID=36100 RepID=UPI001EE5EDF1|nr:sulfotransferase 1C2-like isoform X1 [Haliotis rubra]
MATPAEKATAAGLNADLVMLDGFVEVEFMVDRLKRVKDLPIRDDDILLCTFPKSGTHWTWEILNMIVAGTAEYAKHWQNSAWLEYRTEEELEALASPRILHTHLRPSQLPETVWDKRCKVVYVRRNPKDCVVSSFSQLSKQIWKDNPTGKPTYTGTWDDFIDLYLNGCIPLGPYFEHTIEWTNISEAKKNFEICKVHYEDMKQDCVREIRRMADYLGRPLSDKTYQDISEACSFKNLKHANEKLKDQTYHFQWQGDSSGYFRKGTTGDWKNWFTVAQSERFDRVYEESLNETFPY